MVNFMKTVIDSKSELTINKSKFITLFYQVNSLNDINNKLSKIKLEYKDATHYCYAYIVDNYIKASDDGEPSGTAGLPILNILKKEQLDHVLCVVIRYFGGIKLGAGGLVRAYSNATKNGLKIKSLEKGFLIKISFTYDKIKDVEYLLNNCTIINKDFSNLPEYEINMTINDFNKIKDKLNQICKIDIIKEIYM